MQTPSDASASDHVRAPREPHVLHLVVHTHWDREWYRTAEEFRLGLVALIDEVLDGAAGTQFLLDGQAITLDDYLAARAERRDALIDAFREGRLEAGPWYVLADNLIPSGEALVRNLLAGSRTLRELGAASSPVLYCPDAFGHPAALPPLASGFGCQIAVVWRGLGGAGWPAEDTVRWRGTDGSVLLTHHLSPDGYEFASNLPTDAAAAAERWARMREVLYARSRLGVVLLPNGADHHAVQSCLGDAHAALATAAAPAPVKRSSLGTFANALVSRASAASLPTITGELRDSPGYTWALQGTFATRAAQKRANAALERLMVRDVEPWAALARWHGAASTAHRSAALWKLVLASHPHDTLCGCSIDAVARAMDTRLAAAMRAATLAGRRHRETLLGRDAADRGERERWRHVVVVRNRVPRERGGLVELEIDVPLADVPVGPHSAQTLRARENVGRVSVAGVEKLQLLSRHRQFAREESPRHYPVNALVERRRYLGWMASTAPLGLSVHAVGAPAARRTLASSASPALRVERGLLENQHLRLAVGASGALSLHTPGGLRLDDLLGIQVQGERGDLYTHSPIPDSTALGVLVTHRVGARGPLRGEIVCAWRVRVPPREVQTATGETRRHRAQTLRVDVTCALDAGSPFLRLHVRGVNSAPDHRLRLVVRSGLRDASVWADAAFGPVRRPLVVPDETEATMMEARSRTAPLHRYVSLYGMDRGLTVFGDGLAEYEATEEGDVALTLLRATGELSRHDLPERPGHAGWPGATPDAQCLGPFEAQFALMPHGPRNETAIAAVEHAADDFLLPLVGESWRSAVAPPDHVRGIALEGEGLAFSACKERETGEGIVVRCLNLLDRHADGAWHLPGIEAASLARLDESILGALHVNDDRVRFQAEPHAVVTIVLQRGARVTRA